MEVADGEWRLGRFHFDSIVIIARKLCLNALALLQVISIVKLDRYLDRLTPASPQALLGVKPTKLNPS
jgi:hypothetical protein